MSTTLTTAADFRATQAERLKLEQVLHQKRERLTMLPLERQRTQRALDAQGVLRLDNERDDLSAELPKLEQRLAELVERERIAGDAWLQHDREARHGAGAERFAGRRERAIRGLLAATVELRTMDEANRALAQIDAELGRDPDAVLRGRCPAAFLILLGEHLAAWMSRGTQVRPPAREEYERRTDELGGLLVRAYDAFYGGR